MIVVGEYVRQVTAEAAQQQLEGVVAGAVTALRMGHAFRDAMLDAGANCHEATKCA